MAIVLMAVLVSTVLPIRHGIEQLIADGEHSFGSLESSGESYYILYANDTGGWYRQYDNNQTVVGEAKVTGSPSNSVSIRHFGDDSLVCTWDHNTTHTGIEEDGFMTLVDKGGNIILANSSIEAVHNDSQINSIATPIPNVGYAILWQSYGQEKHIFAPPSVLEWGIWMRVFDHIGKPISNSSFNINIERLLTQSQPAVDTLGSGNVVVVWQGDTLYSKFEINIALLSVEVTGNPPTASINYRGIASTNPGFDGKVNDHPSKTPDDRNPELSCAEFGCLIVWGASSDIDGDGWSVIGRYFDERTRNFTGDQFIINTQRSGDQRTPYVAALADGSFAVTWTSTVGDGDGTCIIVTTFPHFNSTVPSLDEQVVNTKSSGDQRSPVVEPFKNNGGFIVMWYDVELKNYLYQAYTTEVLTDTPDTKIPDTEVPVSTDIPLPPDTVNPSLSPNTSEPVSPQVETDAPDPLQPIVRTAIPYMLAEVLDSPEDKTTIAQDGIRLLSVPGAWMAFAPFSVSGVVLSTINIINRNPMCEQLDEDAEIPFILHPLNFKISDSYLAGAAVGNVCLIVAVVVLFSCITLLYARLYTGSIDAARRKFHYPGILVPQICLFLPNTIYYSLLALRDGRGLWAGIVGIVFVFIVLIVLFKLLRIDHKKCSNYSLYDQGAIALPQTQSFSSYFMGTAAWESSSHARGYVDQYGILIEANTHQAFTRGHYLFLNYGFLFVLAAICSIQPTNDKSCVGHQIALFLVVLLQLLVIWRKHVYSVAFIRHWTVASLFFMLAAITAGGIAGVTRSARFKDATESIILVIVCSCNIKLLYDVIIYFTRVRTRYASNLLLSLKSNNFCYGNDIASPIVQKSNDFQEENQNAYEGDGADSGGDVGYKPPSSSKFQKPPVHPLSIPRQVSTPAVVTRAVPQIPPQPSLLTNTSMILQLQPADNALSAHTL